MPQYDNRNRFTLFRNTKKREGKQDADFNGTFTDKHGREYWINAWSQTPKNGGDKFLSGSIKLKDAPKDGRNQPAPQQRVELEDDVPFGPEFR
jgi:hypothetical protein